MLSAIIIGVLICLVLWVYWLNPPGWELDDYSRPGPLEGKE